MAQLRYGVAHKVFTELQSSRVDNYDEFCYFNKSAIASKAKEIMQHLYGVQSSANTNRSANNIPAANTSSAELCSLATDNITLSNELQNAIAAVSVVQTSTSTTANEFEFGSLQKEFKNHYYVTNCTKYVIFH
jgi:Tfp pilus assembly protein PilX